ncbi:diaminopimelate decarboxylase [Luteococcus sp. OSA5]|uniref:diaminopimelate decarboxylase n=1 Tax=Luteococcus sp. OSA5 TaxID=3401630 RepID=UPI003B429F27
MTHTHVAGSIHADATAAGPQWLDRPTDVNALDPALWSRCVERGEDGVVRIAGLGVDEIAASQSTPTYVVDEEDFRQRARAFRDAFSGWQVYYAGKSFLTRTVARWIKEEGLYLDVCSGGELAVALAGGMDPARIGLHGNNKSVDELALALSQGVGRIIVDSLDEIGRIEQLCSSNGWKARVMVRVTTGVEAHTHEYIATAHEDQKFGFSVTNGQAMVAMVRCHYSEHMELLGVHSHIGSQIFDTHGFEVAARRTMKLLAQFAEATGTELPELDLGGGFGIAYTSADTPATPDALASNLREIVEHEARGYNIAVPTMSIEPGRAISGPTAFALYTVGTVKVVDIEGGQQRVYVSVDGGMSDNIRPALYAAEYSAAVVSRASHAEPVLCRVVGKHCEGGDILVRDVFLPADIAPGDLVAVPAAGAYSRAMASNYNLLTKPAVVSVRDGKLATMLRRETLEDLMRLDVGE